MSKIPKDDAEKSELDLEDLFALAKPRVSPGDHVTRRVRNQVHSEWQSAIERSKDVGSKARNGRRYMAMAAALIVAVAVGFLATTFLGPAAVVFDSVSVARVDGEVSLTSDSGATTALLEDQRVALSRGDVLETAAGGGTTLALDGNRELRVGGDTRVIVVDAGNIRLERGNIYLDSGAQANSAGKIVIDTEHGQVRHLGTRFLVGLSPSILRVDVRDGQVEIEDLSGERIVAGPGHSLVMDAQGSIERGADGGSGPQWQWAEQLVPPLRIEGQSLYTIITWAARETGHPVEFASAQLEKSARETVLHGDLILSDPMHGLAQVMLTTRMGFVLRNDVLVITSRT